MAGVAEIRSGDADVYEATAVVNGGDLVIPSGAATVNAGVTGIQQAGAGALNVLGVALRRAEPVANQNLSATDGDGFPVTYPNPVNELTTVVKAKVVNVVYTASAVAFGAKLIAAAAGQVAAAGATPDARSVIGECRVTGGMGAGGGVGAAYIY